MIDKTIQDDLLAYVDGQLPEPRQAEIDSLVASDNEVAAEVDRLRAEQDLLRATPRVQAPDLLWPRIQRAIAPRPVVLRPVVMRWAGAATAACLLAMVAWFALPGEPESFNHPVPNPLRGRHIAGSTEALEFVKTVYPEAEVQATHGDYDRAHATLAEIESFLADNDATQLPADWRDKLDRLYLEVTLELVRDKTERGDLHAARELWIDLETRLKARPVPLDDRRRHEMDLLKDEVGY